MPKIPFVKPATSSIFRFIDIVILLLSYTLSSFCYAYDIGYQGTHILTHGALEELAKVFEKKYGKSIFVKGGGCADGIAVVANNRLEMGGICCPLNNDVAKKNNLIAHEVASDIKVVIVNPKNPLTNLSLKQVSDIHKGHIKKWKEVGGYNKPIAVIFRQHCQDKEEPVRELLGIDKISEKAIVVNTDKEVIEYVEKFPAAIGITSRVFAKKARVKMINIDGISPTPENTEKGIYKLKGGLYVITKGQPSGDVKKFIDFILSREGQSIIGKEFAKVK
ncbi:phosphate ABC transporter substrate-binding protein [Dissulfurispira thermophila]|uniref:Phosphate ABC transporter substrate-binding protein n=2 Tax=root TaxID=1 RepID=A0A7G1H1Y1_9BACT|nr:substrate-binding domain-containing protein [Dissulfurispira thermophila]BCB96239.1 phosphate ABC transporter substrate-binding protein [Dissulfurispira thermophila]